MMQYRYPNVDPHPSFPAIEDKILEFWRLDRTFEASVEQRPGDDQGADEFVFYDGPPFANGLPHYGHLLTGFIKDAIPRFQTMKGHRVPRRFGWDCHGLPAEMEVERETGISGRAAILEYGIERFNHECRRSVLKYTRDWEAYVTRQARWVDFERAYKTMDLPYMESVMWAFKSLWQKGLLYEGHRVLPFCWECETPLSNFETRLDDAYRDRQDPALTVRFTLTPTPTESSPVHLLVWTTTPWTLPSNLAIAVDPAAPYVVFEENGEQFVVGEAAVHNYHRELAGARRVAVIGGTELVGRTYEPLFGFFAEHPNAFRILAGEFVASDEGTGAVHMAPGFGEDDQSLCEANGIQTVCPVDARGRFTIEIPPWEGVQVFDANSLITRDLKGRGKVLRHDTIVHSYPHCWRTDTPLIYKAVSSWFVDVTSVKERTLELNQQINWVPGHVRDGAFGKWLAGARDWSITRNRFWGSPIPVWKSDDPAYPRIDVYGSLDEIERDFGVRPEDLHRPQIDQLTRPNPDDPSGRSTMRRVEDVLDCWFESGSMPYAQLHYPFENRERFEKHFPADFIVEYIGQTRAWFYNLHVLATALFDKPAFTNCVVHGVILGNDGQKASKRRRNYPDPVEMFATHGADAVRWSMFSSPVMTGQDVIVDEKRITDAVRQVVLPLWNVWYFFALYANTDRMSGSTRAAASHVLDRYILAKTGQLVADASACMGRYDLLGACRSVTLFMDALNNWYIRRSRERVWKAEADQDKQDTYDTLFTVITTVCRLCAPLLPLLTEEIYRGISGERSVHLTDYPRVEEYPSDPDLVADMDMVRDVCSAALSIRRANDLRVRLPLARLTVAGRSAARLRPYVDLIADEVNAKMVELSDDVERWATPSLSVDSAAIGRRLGRDTQKTIAAVKAGEWSRSGDGIAAAGAYLLPSEFSARLSARDEGSTRILEMQASAVVLDLTLTDHLVREGLARDIIRWVQQARRDAALNVSDRIDLWLDLAPAFGQAAKTHREQIARATLAVAIIIGELPDDVFVANVSTDGEPGRIGVRRAPTATPLSGEASTAIAD